MAKYRRENRKEKGWKSGTSGRKDGLCCRCRQPLDGAHKAYCRSCYAAWKRENYEKNKDRHLENAKRWRIENPEKAKEAARRSRLKRDYGISPEEYEELMAKQGGLCAACRCEPTFGKGRSLHIDHDHETGEVLGLLCTKCNSARGLLDNSVEKMTRLAAYQAGIDSRS